MSANLLALAASHRIPMPVTLVTGADRLVAQAPPRASRTLQQKLSRRGLTIRTHTRIVGRKQQTLIAEDGSRIDAETVVLATGLEAHPLVEYQPQKRYLAIFNLGDGTVLATWGPCWWNGRTSMWLKDLSVIPPHNGQESSP